MVCFFCQLSDNLDPFFNHFLTHDFCHAADLLCAARTFSVRHRFTLVKYFAPLISHVRRIPMHRGNVFHKNSALDHPRGPTAQCLHQVDHFRHLPVHHWSGVGDLTSPDVKYARRRFATTHTRWPVLARSLTKNCNCFGLVLYAVAKLEVENRWERTYGTPCTWLRVSKMK